VEISTILAEIDKEIAQLQHAKAVLSGITSTTVVTKGAKKLKRKKRNLTPEGRKRISEAMKRRWAARRKNAAAK
jgi:hypothetical protein